MNSEEYVINIPLKYILCYFVGFYRLKNIIVLVFTSKCAYKRHFILQVIFLIQKFSFFNY